MNLLRTLLLVVGSLLVGFLLGRSRVLSSGASSQTSLPPVEGQAPLPSESKMPELEYASGRAEQGTSRVESSSILEEDRTLIGHFDELVSKLSEPCWANDLEAGMQERYRGFDPEDMLLLYPLVADIQTREMNNTLQRALESGDYLTEWVPAGEPFDMEKYKEPGETFQTIGSRSVSLGNGVTEYHVVPISRTRFPEMYARNFEELWLHDKIDQAGICEVCKRPPPANVRVTLTPR